MIIFAAFPIFRKSSRFLKAGDVHCPKATINSNSACLDWRTASTSVDFSYQRKYYCDYIFFSCDVWFLLRKNYEWRSILYEEEFKEEIIEHTSKTKEIMCERTRARVHVSVLSFILKIYKFICADSLRLLLCNYVLAFLVVCLFCKFVLLHSFNHSLFIFFRCMFQSAIVQVGQIN